MAKIKFRRDTAATWTEANPVLAQGEPGFEHTTGRLKIGDGVTAWNSLAYSDSGSGGGDLTTITGAQVGNQITINTTIDGTTPDLENASSINYIPTSTLLANDWIGSGTNDPSTYPIVRFADGSTFAINAWNTDVYPDTGNGTSGFLSLNAGGFYAGAQVWPITITSYNYVAGTTPGRGIDVNGLVWKFDQDGILTVPGEIQSIGLDNLVLRSKDNINLYAGDVPGDDSEGGDINIYAGKGDPDNGGGDVRIRGGRGGDLYGQFNTGNEGGYVELRGGYSTGTIAGGYVELTAGSSDRGKGGDVRIFGGYGSDDMLKLDNVSITDISLDTPVQVTLAVDHNLDNSDAINFSGITTTTQLNNIKYYIIVVGNNAVTLFQDRELTIPVSGAGMTAYITPGVATETATNANAQQNNYFTQYIVNAPTIGNVQVGWTATGPGLNGTKTVTEINPADPVSIIVDGSDGSVFIEGQSYTFTEPTTTGSGTAYSSAHGGDITLQPGNTYDSSWGDIGRTLIRGETQIGNESGNIWKFGVDGTLKLPSGSPILFGNGNSRIQAGMGFHINSEEGISLEAVDVTDPLNPISRGWYFDTNGNINLPSGSVISETASTISIAPPTAAAGQSLVVRPTAALWSVNSSGFISYGNPITISVTLSSFPYFGTINYEITGPGVTEQSLGRPITGKLTFVGIPSIDTQTVTWTIPANSNITEFTFTITSVDGTRSTDIQIENDPALYYNFEFNALPVGYFVTVTNDNITNLEFSHVHLVAGDPATVDLYLGDDDQFVKIEKNGGNVVVGTNANTKNWTFGTDGNLTLPSGNTTIGNLFGSDAIISVANTAFGILSQGSTGSGGLQWLDTVVEPLNVAGIAVNSPYAASTGSVQIYTGTVGIPPQNAWTFNPDGSLTLPNEGIVRTGNGTPQVGSTRTIVTDSNEGTGAGTPNVVDVAYDNTIIPTYYYSGGGNPVFTDSTITFANGDVRTITSIISMGGYIEITYSGITTNSSPEFPIVLKTGNYVAATTAPEWTFGTDGSIIFPDNTVQTTAWAGGRVVTAPASSIGAAGDKQGDLAFDGSYMYYCTQNYASEPYSTTIVLTYTGLYPDIVKGSIPQPQAGWAFVHNGTTYTLASNAVENNPGEWNCELTTSISVTAGDTVTVGPVFSADIWKRVAWSVDTW